jgi:hypothetical protein
LLLKGENRLAQEINEGGSKMEVKAEKVPWIQLMLLTALLSFLAMASYRLMSPQGSWMMCKYNFGIISRATCVAIYPYLLLALIYPFRKILKLSPSMLTYIYTAGLISSFTLGFGYEDWILQFARPRIYDTIGLLNVWWEPSLSSVQAMITGGIATDWIQWGPLVFIISLIYISFFFFTSSIVSIFRRSWIDVEKLPFPLTLNNHELLQIVGGGGEVGKKVMPFSLGIILGFVYNLPIFLTKVFPWFPDIYSSSLVCPGGAYQIPANNPLSTSILGLGAVSADPIAMVIFFLAPLSVQFNVWFWTLVMMVLEQIAYSFGYYTAVPGMSGSDKIGGPGGFNLTPPFYWPIPSMLGGFIALTVMYIFLHRNYVVETMKMALHRSNPELERKEAMSYRTMYLILIFSFIVCVASLMMLDIDFLAAFMMTITSCFVTWFAMTLIMGMTGFGASDLGGAWSTGFLRIIWPDPSTAPLNLDEVMSTLWTKEGANVATYGFGNGFYTTALSYKMADLTGTSNRNTFLVSVACMLVSVPVIMASSVWFVNTYGIKVLNYFACSLQDQCATNPVNQLSLPSSSIYASYGAAGFIIVALLSFLHARFIWFPFEPIGFIIATSFPGQWNGVWSAFLIAWAAKTIVLRVGGSSLYERYALPIVGGFITGIVLSTTIGIFVNMVRFYIPF